MTTSTIKKAATEGIFVRLTFDGALKRSKIYKSNVTVEERLKFRNSMASILPKFLDKIQEKRVYTDNNHYKMLKTFAGLITKKHGRILTKNQLRIGNAQKFLNLYWKVCWLLKKGTSRPIHCPFDSIVIKHLGTSVKGITWTKLESMEDYKKLVETARQIVSPKKSIAEWELEIYQRSVNYKEQMN